MSSENEKFPYNTVLKGTARQLIIMNSFKTSLRKCLIPGLLILILISGCYSNQNIDQTSEINALASTTAQTMEPTETSPPTPTLTPTIEPTNTPSPSPTFAPRAWRIPVLEYHNPSYFGGEQVKMTPEWFLKQMQWLYENNFHTLNGEELHYFIIGQVQPQRKSVVLRFDIGLPDYEEYSEIVIPMLREYGFHAFVFVLTTSFTDDCSHPENMICWDDLVAWEEEGLITVGSHGIEHPDYKLITQAYKKWDAGESKKIIEEALGHPIYWFAYPYDSVPDNPNLLLEPLGYWGAFTGWPGFSDRSVEFGIEDIWEISSYYPYSSDDKYPMITTSGPYKNSEFSDLILAAIEVDEGGITPFPTDMQDPSDEERAQALANFTNYCLSHNGKELNEYYLEEHAFKTDISIEARQDLGIPVLVEPVCHFRFNNLPEAIVLHFTGSMNDYNSTVSYFRKPDLGISAHYIIDRDGTVVQMVPESYVAYHVSCFGNAEMFCLPDAPLAYDEYGYTSFPETRSIGIELANAGPLVYLSTTPFTLTDKQGIPFEGEPFVYSDFSLFSQYRYEYWEPYAPEQIASLEILIEDIFERWGIDLLLGHNEIQPNIDPGPALAEFIENYKK